MSLTVLMCLIYVVILTTVITFLIFKGDSRLANNRLNKIEHKESGGHLFDDWAKKIYYAFGNKSAEKIAKKLGINAEKYYKNCEITKKTIDLEGTIVKTILSIISACYCLLIGLVANNWYVGCIGVLVFALFAMFPVKRMDDAANNVRAEIVKEMPRFLDMMQTALYINLPIEEAINITAKYLKGTRLADEFSMTMAELKVGAYDWQTALEKMSQKYEIDVFSDFVLDVITAYNKGISIYEVIVRENKEIKQTNILSLKENASKLNSTILLPITIFKLIPLILIMCIPIAIQLKGSGVL